MDTKKLTKLSLLTAIALIMFIIELRLPSLCPINGVKLGLANIVTVYAVYQFKSSEVAMLHFTRIILGAMFSGNVSTLLYSLSGGILCYIGMVLLKNVVPMKHMWIVSIVGAILHNTGQMIMAVIVMGSFTVLSYYPILIFSGCIAGFFTAMCAQYIIKKGALKSNESNIV